MRLHARGTVKGVTTLEPVGLALGYGTLALATAIQVGDVVPGCVFALIVLAFGASTFAFRRILRLALLVVPFAFVAILTWAIQLGPVDCWPSCGSSREAAEVAAVTLLALMVGIAVLGLAVAARRSLSGSA